MDLQWFVENVLRMGPYSVIFGIFTVTVYASMQGASISGDNLSWLAIWAFIAIAVIRWSHERTERDKDSKTKQSLAEDEVKEEG